MGAGVDVEGRDSGRRVGGDGEALLLLLLVSALIAPFLRCCPRALLGLHRRERGSCDRGPTLHDRRVTLRRPAEAEDDAASSGSFSCSCCCSCSCSCHCRCRRCCQCPAFEGQRPAAQHDDEPRKPRHCPDGEAGLLRDVAEEAPLPRGGGGVDKRGRRMTRRRARRTRRERQQSQAPRPRHRRAGPVWAQRGDGEGPVGRKVGRRRADLHERRRVVEEGVVVVVVGVLVLRPGASSASASVAAPVARRSQQQRVVGEHPCDGAGSPGRKGPRQRDLEAAGKDRRFRRRRGRGGRRGGEGRRRLQHEEAPSAHRGPGQRPRAVLEPERRLGSRTRKRRRR